MPQHLCQNCGQTFSSSKREGEGDFCNLGCAVRRRVPVDAQGNFPVNRHLVAVVIAGFLFLNQGMMVGTSALVAQRGRLETAQKLAWISVALGLCVWGFTLVVRHREKVARSFDWAMDIAVAGVLFAGIWKGGLRTGLALAAVSICLVWNFRGLFFKQRVK